MANIKSAKKRILTSAKRAERNKAAKSEVKTYVKKVDAAVTAGDKAAAQQAFVKAQSVLDAMARKHVLHRNAAARQKSRLSASIKAMA